MRPPLLTACLLGLASSAPSSRALLAPREDWSEHDLDHYRLNECEPAPPTTCFLWTFTVPYVPNYVHPGAIAKGNKDGTSLKLFNSDCRKIGQLDLPKRTVHQHGTASMTSELPFTVEVELAPAQGPRQFDNPNGNMWYAGRRYDLKEVQVCSWCENWETDNVGHCCRVNFDCSAVKEP